MPMDCFASYWQGKRFLIARKIGSANRRKRKSKPTKQLPTLLVPDFEAATIQECRGRTRADRFHHLIICEREGGFLRPERGNRPHVKELIR